MNKLSTTCPPSEFSNAFLKGMLARMEVSYHKYGPVKDAYPHKVDAMKSLVERLEKYKATGNTEWLIDAANFAMIEFMRPSVPGAKFTPTDSNESPGRVWANGRASQRANK